MVNWSPSLYHLDYTVPGKMTCMHDRSANNNIIIGEDRPNNCSMWKKGSIMFCIFYNRATGMHHKLTINLNRPQHSQDKEFTANAYSNAVQLYNDIGQEYDLFGLKCHFRQFFSYIVVSRFKVGVPSENP